MDFIGQLDECADSGIRILLQLADIAVDKFFFRVNEGQLNEPMAALQAVAEININGGLFLARMCLDALAFEQAQTLAGGQFLEVDSLFDAFVFEGFFDQFHKSPLSLRRRVARRAPRRTA